MIVFNNAPKDWQTISTRKVYSNYFLQLFEDTLNIKGTNKIYLRGIRKDYATIVPFVSKEEILIIKSYRHLVDSVEIEVPSGYIDEGETAFEAAKRELEEETGYGSSKMIPIGIYTLDYTMFSQIGNLFIAYNLVKEKEQSLGLMEKIDIEIMNIKEIEKLLCNGKILNSASIVALYRAIAYHKNNYDKKI
jgi:ADP-ribose pyrophosphatase